MLSVPNQSPTSFYSSLNENIRGNFGISWSLQRYQMPDLLGVMSDYFWEGAGMKILEKMESAGFVTGACLCHKHKMSIIMSNFFFAKKE
jgi:hypothetical protein